MEEDASAGPAYAKKAALHASDAMQRNRTEGTEPTGHGIVVRSEKQLIARELGRDYLPTRSLTRSTTALAA